MRRVEFEGQIEELRNEVIGTVEAHFKRKNLTFDIVRFLEGSDTDLGQFLREAYFLGAEIFPLDQKPE